MGVCDTYSISIKKIIFIRRGHVSPLIRYTSFSGVGRFDDLTGDDLLSALLPSTAVAGPPLRRLFTVNRTAIVQFSHGSDFRGFFLRNPATGTRAPGEKLSDLRPALALHRARIIAIRLTRGSPTSLRFETPARQDATALQAPRGKLPLPIPNRVKNTRTRLPEIHWLSTVHLKKCIRIINVYITSCEKQ